MARRPREPVAIPIEPIAGSEPDGFAVAFCGADGSVAGGHVFELVAGTVGTWELTVTVAEPVASGGGFLFQRRGFLLGYRPQDWAPQCRDYVTLEAETDAGLRLVVNTADQEFKPSFAQVIVEQGELAPGDGFTIRVGDRRFGGPGAEAYDVTTLARLCAAVDRDGSGRYVELAASPARVTIIPETRADLLRVLGPSIVAPGEPFALHFTVYERNRNLCETYAGELALRAPDGIEGLPAAIGFGPADGGIVIIEGVVATRPGLYRVGVADEANGLQALSNPMICQDSPDRRLLWGDVHCHCWGDTNLAYMDEPSFKTHPLARHEQARRAGRLDFAAPGPMVPPDHEDRPEVWQACQDAWRANDEPGTYVPFLAYEAHTVATGDWNVIFRDFEQQGHISTWAPVEALYAAYGDREDVLLEAHVGGGMPRWEAYRPAEQRLVEVASGWGCFEWMLQRALRFGYRPAIIGSGDTHLALIGGPAGPHTVSGWYTHWQCPRLNVLDTGFGTGPLAAVWADHCERAAIWEAINQRRTYATSGARIILEVTANGSPSGSEIETSGPIELHILAHACAPVERVDLIRGDRCLHSWRPDALDLDLCVTDAAPLREGAYYARLRQSDGEYAWSTPIWVRCPEGAPRPDPSLPMWNEHEHVDLAALRPNPAEAYEADLLAYIALEEDPAVFSQMSPVSLLEETAGRSALFCAYVEPGHTPVSIRWFYDFDMPRWRIDIGWRDFGAQEMEY